MRNLPEECFFVSTDLGGVDPDPDKVIWLDWCRTHETWSQWNASCTGRFVSYEVVEVLR